MLLVAGADGASADAMAAVNRLSSGYGVTFSDDARDRGEITVGMASRLLANASDVLGRLLKMVHKA
jgi:hypothetical protein